MAHFRRWRNNITNDLALSQNLSFLLPWSIEDVGVRLRRESSVPHSSPYESFSLHVDQKRYLYRFTAVDNAIFQYLLLLLFLAMMRILWWSRRRVGFVFCLCFVWGVFMFNITVDKSQRPSQPSTPEKLKEDIVRYGSTLIV